MTWSAFIFPHVTFQAAVPYNSSPRITIATQGLSGAGVRKNWGLTMKFTRLTAPLLALALIGTTGSVFAQQGYGGPPPQGYGQGGWDAPPQEFRDVQRQGFRDGIEGAHRDMENHRRPSVNNRDEYRHPNVPGRDRHDYKDAFRRGYYAAFQHPWGHGGPGGPGNGYGPGPRPY